MTLTLDGPNKIINLDGAARVSIRAVYSAWADWMLLDDNLKYLPAFSTTADPPKVPVYATLENGWRIRPAAGNYILTLYDGFLYSTEPDPFAPVLSGQEPRIRWENPVVAVGYSTGGALYPLADIAESVWTRSQRTLTAGGITGGVIHVFADGLMQGDEMSVTIDTIQDAVLTALDIAFNLTLDQDASMTVEQPDTTSTVEPDSTLGS